MSLKKRFLSFYFAGKGLLDLFITQPNARIHLVAALVVLVVGNILGLSTWEWVVIIGCITAVLAMEAVNTAIEYLADRISTDYHPLTGKAKDAAAAAVLITAIGAVVVGLIIFVPKVFKLI